MNSVLGFRVCFEISNICFCLALSWVFGSVTYVFVWPYLGKQTSLGMSGIFGSITYVFVWPYLGKKMGCWYF